MKCTVKISVDDVHMIFETSLKERYDSLMQEVVFLLKIQDRSVSEQDDLDSIMLDIKPAMEKVLRYCLGRPPAADIKSTWQKEIDKITWDIRAAKIRAHIADEEDYAPADPVEPAQAPKPVHVMSYNTHLETHYKKALESTEGVFSKPTKHTRKGRKADTKPFSVLRVYREAAGFTQPALMDRSGVNKHQISKAELGQIKLLPYQIHLLADALSIHPNKLKSISKE